MNDDARARALAEWLGRSALLFRLAFYPSTGRLIELRHLAAGAHVDLTGFDAGIHAVCQRKILGVLLLRPRRNRLRALEALLLGTAPEKVQPISALDAGRLGDTSVAQADADEKISADRKAELAEYDLYLDSARSRVPSQMVESGIKAVRHRLDLDLPSLQALAARVRSSGLFEDAFYRASSGLDGSALSPALHYVLIGEVLGFAPSPRFDPRYYAARNPDVVSLGPVLLLHYAEHGRSEKRDPVPPFVKRATPGRFDAGRENVLVVVHDTSRTGAPILGWNIAWHLSQTYNVFTIHLGTGPLTADFQAVSAETHGPFAPANVAYADLNDALRSLFYARTFRYAIVNSAESHPIMEVCAAHLVPTILLVHEYAYYVYPPTAFRHALTLAGDIVFPARNVALAALDVHPPLEEHGYYVLPQGPSQVPPGDANELGLPNIRLKALSNFRKEGGFIVLGAGSVHVRKGVDLFLSTAAAVLRRKPARPVRFVWVGHGYRPDADMDYSMYLQEQIRRSGLSDHVMFIDAVADLKPLYDLTHVFLLTSRLDPLPNVAIDAAMLGLPVVCFEDASGMAEVLVGDTGTAIGVVPYLDAAAAAGVAVQLAEDRLLYDSVADAIASRARQTFDMARYVDRLDGLHEGLRDRSAMLRRDRDFLIDDPSFDAAFFLGIPCSQQERAEAIARYVSMASAPEADAISTRRPAPGFNASAYRSCLDCEAGTLPFIDFVRRGRPAGPWQLPLITPPLCPQELFDTCRSCLIVTHLDASLVADLLRHLAVNRQACDLVISADSLHTAASVRAGLDCYSGGTVEVIVDEGGSKWPLSDLGSSALSRYDIIGYLHGRPDESDGASRYFNWESLLGGLEPMMDAVVGAFAAQSGLGLVFPADPMTPAFDPAMHDLLAETASRLLPLPQAPRYSFDYPQGGMFWARASVFSSLALLERRGTLGGDSRQTAGALVKNISPLVAESHGLTCAAAYVPGLVR